MRYLWLARYIFSSMFGTVPCGNAVFLHRFIPKSLLQLGLSLFSGWSECNDTGILGLNVGATGQLDAVRDGLKNLVECLPDRLWLACA